MQLRAHTAQLVCVFNGAGLQAMEFERYELGCMSSAVEQLLTLAPQILASGAYE